MLLVGKRFERDLVGPGFRRNSLQPKKDEVIKQKVTASISYWYPSCHPSHITSIACNETSHVHNALWLKFYLLISLFKDCVTKLLLFRWWQHPVSEFV